MSQQQRAQLLKEREQKLQAQLQRRQALLQRPVVTEKKSITLDPLMATLLYNADEYSDVLFMTPGFLTSEPNTIFRTVCVDFFSFARSFYVVNGYNNLLSTSSGNLYLTEGNYTIDTFITMLSGLLGSAVTITWSVETGCITLSTTVSFTILPASTCYELIGCDTGTSYTINTTGSTTLPYPANLLGTRYLNIQLLEMPPQNWINTGALSTLVNVPVDVACFDAQIFSNQTGSGATTLPNDLELNHFRIQITDENGYPIDFHGASWFLGITVSTQRYVDVNFDSIWDYTADSLDMLEMDQGLPAQEEIIEQHRQFEEHPIVKEEGEVVLL